MHACRRNRDLMFELLKSPRAKVIFFHEGKCLFQPLPRRSMETAAHEELTAEKHAPTSQPVILQPFGNYKDMVDLKVRLFAYIYDNKYIQYIMNLYSVTALWNLNYNKHGSIHMRKRKRKKHPLYGQ